MKPVPRSYGVSGELKPVKPNSYGVVNMVSVLVSVADSYTLTPLLHTQLELEARVGIGLSHRFRYQYIRINPFVFKDNSPVFATIFHYFSV